MAVQVRLPSALRGLANSKKTVDLEGATVDEVLARLVVLHPQLRAAIYDERLKRRRSIHVFVDGQDVRMLSDGQTPVSSGQLVELISAMSGG